MAELKDYITYPEDKGSIHISDEVVAKIAARAAGVGSDVIEAMPLNDFNRITSAARDFLLDSGY